MDIDDVDLIVLDFDGVLTDNSVYVDSTGNETVKCSRADGLAFDVLKILNKPVFIFSTEKNNVVVARAGKLGVEVLNGVGDKKTVLKKYCYDNEYSLDRVLYVGNDINDYEAMKLCGYSICPADSHRDIKRISNTVLTLSGGCGVIREILEDIMCLNFIEILFNKE